MRGKDIAEEENIYLLKHFEHIKQLLINKSLKTFLKITQKPVTCGVTTSN